MAEAQNKAKVADEVEDDGELWLKREGTHSAFRWTPQLAKRPDMIPITTAEARALQKREQEECLARVAAFKSMQAKQTPATAESKLTVEDEVRIMDREGLVHKATDLKVKVTDKMSDDQMRTRIIRALRQLDQSSMEVKEKMGAV